jgi:hypothetical protein
LFYSQLPVAYFLLTFLRPKHPHHIQELAHLNKNINKIQQLLKSEGICKETIGICKEKMKDFKAPGLQRFRSKLNKYFDQTKTLCLLIKKFFAALI